MTSCHQGTLKKEREIFLKMVEAVKENVPPSFSVSSMKPLSEEAPDPLLYKKLYHASVERCEYLQVQLEKYSNLLSKHQKITELKVCSGSLIRGVLICPSCVQNKALSGLERNKDLIKGYRDSLAQKEFEWQRRLDACLLREETLKQVSYALLVNYDLC